MATGYYIFSGLMLWGYGAGLESSRHQATIGKKALGIVVTDLQGQRITLQTATLRNWFLWIPAVTGYVDNMMGSWKYVSGIGLFGFFAMNAVFVSCFMVALTARTQGWHAVRARKPQCHERGPGHIRGIGAEPLRRVLAPGGRRFDR